MKTLLRQSAITKIKWIGKEVVLLIPIYFVLWLGQFYFSKVMNLRTEQSVEDLKIIITVIGSIIALGALSFSASRATKDASRSRIYCFVGEKLFLSAVFIIISFAILYAAKTIIRDTYFYHPQFISKMATWFKIIIKIFITMFSSYFFTFAMVQVNIAFRHLLELFFIKVFFETYNIEKDIKQ